MGKGPKMDKFRVHRRWAEALGYCYEGHLRGLEQLFFLNPKRRISPFFTL